MAQCLKLGCGGNQSWDVRPMKSRVPRIDLLCLQPLSHHPRRCPPFFSQLRLTARRLGDDGNVGRLRAEGQFLGHVSMFQRCRFQTRIWGSFQKSKKCTDWNWNHYINQILHEKIPSFLNWSGYHFLIWLIFKLTRPPAQVVALQVPVPVLLACQSVVAVVAVAWRRIRRPLDRRSGSAFHRHIDHLGHSQHHIHCARFGLDHILLASWQPVHHNQHIQLLRPEETSEAFYHQQKEENFSEEKQIWWSCLSKPYRTKTGIRAENHFSINHSSESDYRMPPITCRSLSFTCPVNELHRAHLLEAFGLLLADRLKTAWTEPCVHADHSFR